LTLEPSSSRPSSPSDPSPRLRASSRSRRSLAAPLQGRPTHGSRVFTGKVSDHNEWGMIQLQSVPIAESLLTKIHGTWDPLTLRSPPFDIALAWELKN